MIGLAVTGCDVGAAPVLPAVPPQREALLEIAGVVHHYGDRRALAGITLSLRRGETLGLLGPNGAGKSTLMALLSGAIAPQQGQVVLHGHGAPSAAAVRARIGIAPQRLALYPKLSAEENLTFFGRLHGLRGRELRQQVDWALQLAQLTSRRRDRVASFSGGMQRRLNVACAVVHRPILVLLDEPTVGVDPQSRNHIFDCLDVLHRDGHSILYSTHYMEEAERLCERIAIMDHGRVLACAPLPDLLDAHGGGYRVTAQLDVAPEIEPTVTSGPTGHVEWHRATAADAAGVALRVASRARRLAVHPPSLEQVFFNLTGHRLRDE
ncbi:MAG: ABC transporter ATP-binding protein [Polyangiaceae bacterium]